MYKPIYYTRQEKKEHSKIYIFSKKLILIGLIIFLFNFLINIYSFKKPIPNSFFISPLAKNIIYATTAYINSQENSINLEKIVKNVLKYDENNFGIVINNLKTGERYYLNKDKTFDTASLYKLWVMTVAYEQIEDRKIKLRDVLTDDVDSLNKKFNISTKSAELTEGTVSWPVQNALEQMIMISDNYSALLLSEKIGLSNVSDFLQKSNLLSSKIGNADKNPITTASDIGNFLVKLYNGELANTDDTNEMIRLLKNQQVNTKLSKNLPNDTVIAHKTGELDGFSHDVGIVYTEKGNYIIVMLSKADNVFDANNKIAEISKEVYEYFTK